MSADPALFLATVTPDGDLLFDFPAQQRGYCRSKLAGQCVDVTVAPQGLLKSRLQEKGFHAMIQPWARDGGHRIDVLKLQLLAHIFGTMQAVNPITGELDTVLVQTSTAKLNRAQYSELIERTMDIAAECGCVLVAPDEYRRRKERDAKKAEKARRMVEA